MASPLLANTRVVLIRPTLAENVGAVARSMGHFGLGELVLVEGVSATDPKALAVSSGHEALLESSRRVESLEAALAGATLVVGTTARPQATIDRRAVLPAEAAALARDHAASGPVALVFGTEKSGMTNEELRRCHQLVTIPGEADACLNLAQAATICFYEWRLAGLSEESPDRPLTAVAAEAGLDDLAGRLAEALSRVGALKPREAESKTHTLRRVLSQARLSADEAAMVQGLLRAAFRAD